MDGVSADSLKVAVVLVPGFLSVKIRRFFSPPGRSTAFEQFMEAVAFSVANFTVYFLVCRGQVTGENIGSSGWTLQLLSGLGVTSVVMGLVAGVTAGNDWHYRLARRLKLTRRTGRADVWQDVFEDIRGSWLTVHLDDGARILGWAHYYSDEGRKPSVFLRQASWVEDDGSTSPIHGEGILVTELARVKFVEFMGRGGNAGAH